MGTRGEAAGFVGCNFGSYVVEVVEGGVECLGESVEVMFGGDEGSVRAIGDDHDVVYEDSGYYLEIAHV